MLMALNQLSLRYRLVIETFTFCSSANAQSAAVEADKSSSPFNVAPSFTNQNYFTLSVFGVNSPTNDFLPHPTVPIELNSLTGVPSIFRATTPISARPDPSGGYNTGLGEINLFDISFSSQSDIQVGVEPLLTMPTATDPSLVTGKLQAGLAPVAVSATSERVLVCSVCSFNSRAPLPGETSAPKSSRSTLNRSAATAQNGNPVELSASTTFRQIRRIP